MADFFCGQVLYTHQKTKKAKTWQDGTLKVLATGTKAILYDDKGSKLDALHVRASDVVTGEQLESDRYYIQVEELQKHPCSHPAPAAVGHDDASNRLGTGYPDASNRLGTGYPDASNRLGTGYPDASNRLGTGYPDASNRLGTGYPDASNRLGTGYPDTSNSLAMSRGFSHPPEPFAVQPRADHSQTPAGQGIGTRGSAGLKRKRSGFIPPRLVRPRSAEEEAPAPEPDFPGNCFYGNVKSANHPTVPDWAGQHANSASESSFFRGMPDNRQNVGASDRSSANLFCAVKRLSGDAACRGSIPSSAVMAGRDSSPAGEAAEGSMQSSFRSPGSTSPKLASATRNSAWRTFGSASSWSSPILSSHPPGGAVQSTGRDQNAGQELRSKWEQFSPDASDVSEESPSSASHSLAFPAGFVGARMEVDTQNSFPEIPLRPRGSEPVVKRSVNEIMALLGKKKRTSSSMNAASRLSAFENSPTAQFSDFALPKEPGHSDDLVPPAEPNHSYDIVPPAEPNHSYDIVPPAEPNRSNDIVPPAEPNRSNDIVPPAEPNRSNDIVPPAEPNRSNDIVPPAEPNRSNDIVPPAEPNRSNDIVPPAEPSHQAAHPDSSPEPPTCHSSKMKDKKSHCMLSLRTRQHHSPRSPSDGTPDVAVPSVHAQTGSPHLSPDSHVQASSPASEQTTAVTLARKSSSGGSLCPQLSDDGACTSTLKPPLSDTPPRGNISDGQRTGGFKKSDENFLREFPSAVSWVHVNEDRSPRSDLSHHSSPGDMKTLMSPRLAVSTPSLSKHDFEEEEGCFEEETFAVKSVANSSQCLSGFDFAVPDPGAETPCQPFSPASKRDEVCPVSAQIQDPVTEGCSLAVKKRQQSSDAAEDISACGKSESSVEQGRRGWESNARRLSDEAVSTQPNIEAQPRGEPETQPAENAEEQDLGACFEVSLSPLSEEAETDDEAFQNSEQDPGNSHEDGGGETRHPENALSCIDQSLLVARETETVELPESSSEANLAPTLPPEKQCSETVKESLDMDKAGVQTEGKSGAEQPVQHVSVINENICDHVERLGGQDQVTGFVTECNTMGLMTEGSSSVKECTQSQLGKEGCEPKKSAEVDDALKKNGDAKENIDQSDLETEGDNCTSSSEPEIMEAGDGQARQGDSLQTVSRTPDEGVSDAFDSRPKPVSLSQLSQSVSSQNVVDNMKTLNDLDISPDSFVHGQQFEKPPSEDISGGFVFGDQPYTLDRKENTQHCGISEQVDAEKEVRVSWRQNQTLKGTAGEAGMLCHKEQNQVDATASSSFNRWSFSHDLVSTKLTTPSPPSFCVAGQSLSRNSDATEETCSLHHAAVSSSNTMSPRDQIHLPASYKRSAVPMHESMRSKVPRCSHSYSSGQNLSLGLHQNRTDDGDLGRRYSPPLPAPQIFRTVSEALGDREGDVPVLRPGSFCRGSLEDPTWVLQQDRIGSTELHAGRLDELCKHSNEGSGSGVHHHHQPMSSTLPHPDRLTRRCGLGLTSHRQGLDTATDITQAISARLMDYKMQGMVSSDLVERPMAWRRGTDQGSSLLPWLHAQTELHGGVGSDGGTDFVSSMDAGAGFMSLYSRHQKLQRHAREAVCEGVASPSPDGEEGRQLGALTSAWTPEARLSSPEVDENWLSPQLFSQAPRSLGPACRSKPAQRERKLRPVLTAPDEIAKGARDAPAALAKDGDKVPAAGDRGLATGQNTPCGLACCTDTDDSADTSGGCDFNREMASHQPGCDALDLPVSHESVSDAVELMDFSGFEDSFPESDVQDEQLLAAEKAAMSGSSTLGQTSVTKQAKCGLGLKQECEGDSFAPLGDGGLAYTAGGCGVQQGGLAESSHSTNTPSSPAFVIADGALDSMHEEERGGSEQTSACRQDVKQEALPADTGRSSYAPLQRQEKVSRFVRQVQALHPRVNDQDKENHFRLHQAGQVSQSEAFIACKAALRPPAFNQSFGGNFLKLRQVLSDQDHLLAPSAPTDSPPMDLSPPGPSAGRAVLSSRRCGDDSCETLTQTASLALKKHSPHLPSWSRCKLRTPASQPGETEVDRFPSSRFDGNCAQSQAAVPSWQPCMLDSGSASERSAPSEAGATGPSDARGFTAPRKVGLGRFRKPGAVNVSGCLPHTQFQSSLCQELQFFSREEVESQATPERQVAIPPSFESVLSYRQVLTTALIEFVNIQLFGVAKTYHSALSKVDVSAYTEGVGVLGGDAGENRNPTCKCSNTSKVAQVKKEGPNKGRFFYACSGPREKQCKYFQWVDQHSGGSSSVSRRRDGVTQSVRPKFSDPDSIMGYFRGHMLPLYCQCRFVRRSEDQRFRQDFPAWVRPRQTDGVQKKNVLIKLPKKDSGTTHAKDDVWVVSKSLSFAKGETFVARSTFHGPNTHGEVAIDPMAGYSASQWTDGGVCHAIHCGNAATELSCVANLQEHVDMTSLPVLPHLLSLSNQPFTSLSSRMSSKGFKAPLARQGPGKLHAPGPCVHDLAAEFIAKYQLNTDQATALQRAADMMNKDAEPIASVLLIHGVFGAGKSFLLSVLILFLVEVFQRNDTYSPGVPFPWKLLLSSTTNVAVDRVLQGLLELRFDDFARVGSVKKIAKPVLPYSVHASGSESQELKDLQEMLRSQDITPAEKHCVRKSIERHKLGENRKRLGAVRVVGVTCAACSFQCLDKMRFPFVVLDECSQMTEPASLLPIARFACEKMVLVGDPKQLDPTLQGSDAAHEEGLEQTLLDRLMKMGHEPVMLRTQYRCHPIISAVSNSLFYQNQLVDGVTAHDRPPVLDLFPSLCFYDVSSGQEQTNSSGSFINEAEAQFVILLLSVLAARGLPASSVGVITLYKAQARHIVDAIRGCRSVTCEAQQQMAGVQVSTVDAFQGGERDIIILSCVRTRSLGFIDSDKRMNVALTRARHHLLIVGHLQNLYGNKHWAQVISHCQGVEGGIVSASTAGRQLQAILDQLSGDRGDAASHASSTHTAGQHSDKPLRTVRAKHKQLPQRADAENPLEASDARSPAVSASSDSVLRTGAVDATRPQQSPLSHQERAQDAAMEENLAAVEGLRSDEGPNLVVKQIRSSLGRSQVKPLVIDSENEEEGSSSDDSLPDGL